MEQFYTTEQVAKFLQLHPFTILKFIREGKLKGVKIGRMYRIMESDMKAFLEERMTSTSTKKVKTSKEVQIPKPRVEETVRTVTEHPEETFPIHHDNIADENTESQKQNDPYYII